MSSPTPPSLPLASVILAAGKGTRMKSARPKVMHPVGGRAMLAHGLATADALGSQTVVVVLGPGMDEAAMLCAPHRVAVQTEAKGTGHAVATALPALDGFSGLVLVLYGDVPLITPESCSRLVNALEMDPSAAIALAVMTPADAGAYGRIVLNESGSVARIVEFADASAEERAISLCNGGILCVRSDRLAAWLSQVSPRNAQGEYYLTDLPALAAADGFSTIAVSIDETELLGANSRGELARLEGLFQDRRRREAMAAGVTLTAPDTVFFCYDTVLAPDVSIGPNVVFGPGVQVESGAEILPFCHLEGVRVKAGARIGPFARLRPGAVIGENAHIGNFVEVKNATIGAGAKANHLTYIGDAEVGARSNIGAGVITCNYDGVHKHRTVIGADCFVGSDVTLVAPLHVGDGAYIGAGSTITRDVPEESLAVARAHPLVREGWARSRRRKGVH